MNTRKVLLIGDSHIYAIQAALGKSAALLTGYDFEALRVGSQKTGAKIGDITFDQALERCCGLTPRDFVISLLRGNQFNTIGLIQHPQPFDLLMPEISSGAPTPDAVVLPLQTMKAYFAGSLESGYGTLLVRLKENCKSPVACLAPPAPKEDTEHILQNAETYFREQGVGSLGVTPAALRLKLWTLQQEALASFCARHGMIYLGNPDGTRDPAGFLKREFYARDATHGNSAYGRMVLRQVAALVEQRAAVNTSSEP